MDQRERKRVTLKEMLRWAYNRQQVDSLTGKTLDRAQDELAAFVPGYAADSTIRFKAVAELGTSVDCGGSNRFARNDVHPDAEELHDIVLELGPIDARLVIEFGHHGTHPEPTEAIPRPVPFVREIETGTWRGGRAPGRRKRVGIESWEWQEGEGKPAPADRCGQCTWRGEGMLHVIRVAETILERVPVYIVVGRRKTRISHYEEKRIDVLYCPIEWWPDLAWVEAVNGIAAHWERVLNKLRERLSEVEFREHEIVYFEEKKVWDHRE